MELLLLAQLLAPTFTDGTDGKVQFNFANGVLDVDPGEYQGEIHIEQNVDFQTVYDVSMKVKYGGGTGSVFYLNGVSNPKLLCEGALIYLIKVITLIIITFKENQYTTGVTGVVG